MARDRVRQRREFVLVGWSASGSEPSLASSGSIVEFENDLIEQMQEAVARKHGFTVTSHKMELYRLCRICQRIGVAKSEA